MRELLYPSLSVGCVGAWCPSRDSSRSTLLLDRSGNGKHGTLTNMDPATDWQASEGKVALDFDGSNDHVTAPVVKPNSSVELSVSMFCYFRSFSNSPLLYTWMIDGFLPDYGFLETNNTGSQLYFGNRNTQASETGYRTYTLSQALVTNRWYQITTIKLLGADTGSLLVNGNIETSYTGTLYATTGSASAIRFGAYTGAGNNLDGQLDDMRVYNRSLVTQESKLLAMRRGVAYETKRITRAKAAASAAASRRNNMLMGCGF